MEIRSTIHINKRWVGLCCCVLFLLMLCGEKAMAQLSIKSYTVKNGKMFIALGKDIKENSLDSFITQYDLADLQLKQFIRTGFRDSLVKSGWQIETDTKELAIISRPLLGIDDIKNPAERIIMASKEPLIKYMFPAVSSNVKYGINRFRNKAPFAETDSLVNFYLRGNKSAKKVMLAGSFNDWSPDNLPMTKTDSGWIAPVRLSAGKYWYKFIVDGNWTVDNDNRTNENDGLGNMNSVYYKTNVVIRLSGYGNAKDVYVAGSFNDWNAGYLLMSKTATGWELPMYLANGTYTYRFVADRKWFPDPDNPEKYPNEYGDFNSVFRIGKPYLFYLEGYSDARKVILTGSFNGWRKDELLMKKTDKGWELPYTLGAGNYEYYYLVDGTREIKQSGNNATGVRNFYFVIEPNYTFHLKGYSNAKKIYLAGDFNNWSPNTFAMDKQRDEWVLPVHLSQGKHLYKFVVDGKWIRDPDNKLYDQDQFESGNSIIWIDH